VVKENRDLQSLLWETNLYADAGITLHDRRRPERAEGLSLQRDGGIVLSLEGNITVPIQEDGKPVESIGRR